MYEKRAEISVSGKQRSISPLFFINFYPEQLDIICSYQETGADPAVPPPVLHFFSQALVLNISSHIPMLEKSVTVYDIS